MVKETLAIVNELFDQPVTSDDIADIEGKHAQGKSLGASIALYMNDKAATVVSDLGDRFLREPELEIGWAKERLISIVFYRLPLSAFLDSEEVVRSGEPEPNPPPDEETEVTRDIIGASLGHEPLSQIDSSKLIIAEIQSYLKKQRRGDLLRESGSPQVIVNSVTNDLLRGLEADAFKAIQEDNTRSQRNILIATISVLLSKRTFNKLYGQLNKPLTQLP